MREDGVTQETRQHIQRYEQARKSVERYKEELNKAECELANATNALGKFMAPIDAKPDETFNVWFGASLLSVKYNSSSGNALVSWRTRSPKDFLDM